MTTVVIMPGGFHPFHAGHAALYQSARRTFPDAEVYVAATNDTSARPFPFAVKEKLARLAGVEPGHFVQVKSPFRAEEITARFDPAKDQLIFVRSEKDANKPPQAGGVKKDGSPAYLQPLLGARKLEPFAKHAYMAYLPTVEFGPGFTSATEIRNSWPKLDERQKTALVMSLYPATQSNLKLATNVVKMLDTAIDSEQSVTEGAPIVVALAPIDVRNPKKAPQPYRNQGDIVPPTKPPSTEKRGVKGRPGQRPMPDYTKDVDENQGWAATFTAEQDGQCAGGDPGGGMMASYQRRENQPIAEKTQGGTARDAELIQALQYLKQHYPMYAGDADMAMAKWLQRSIKHSEINDVKHDRSIANLNSKVDALVKLIKNKQSIQAEDYIEEGRKK